MKHTALIGVESSYKVGDGYMVCSFFGHRNIDYNDEIKIKVKTILIKLIEEERVVKFLFGSKSLFNQLCYDVVTELKMVYPQICRIAYPCKSETAQLVGQTDFYEKAYFNVSGKKIQLKEYEEIFEDGSLWHAGKASYVERNCLMIKHSDFCVFYFRSDYTDKKSGTKLAVEYAKRKKKKIIVV